VSFFAQGRGAGLVLLNPLFIYVAYQKFAVVSANGNIMAVDFHSAIPGREVENF